MSDEVPPSLLRNDGYWTRVTRADAAVRDVILTSAPGGGHTLSRSGKANTFPADWYVTGELRGLDTLDIPWVKAWFGGICAQLEVENAELTIDVDNGDRIHCAWTGTELRDMPPRRSQ